METTFFDVLASVMLSKIDLGINYSSNAFTKEDTNNIKYNSFLHQQLLQILNTPRNM